MNDMEIETSDLVWRNDLPNHFNMNRSKFLEHQGTIMEVGRMLHYKQSSRKAVESSIKSLV
jgi:hypothetical protein